MTGCCMSFPEERPLWIICQAAGLPMVATCWTSISVGGGRHASVLRLLGDLGHDAVDVVDDLSVTVDGCRLGVETQDGLGGADAFLRVVGVEAFGNDGDGVEHQASDRSPGYGSGLVTLSLVFFSEGRVVHPAIDGPT